MSNLERLRAKLVAENLPALLVSEIDNVRWVSGFTGSSGFVLLTADDSVFVTDSRYTIQAGDEVKEMRTASFASPMEASEFLKVQADQLGISELAFEASSTSYATYESYKKRFAPIQLIPAKDIISPLRMIKTPDEVELVRQACGMADACFEHVRRMVQPGVREYDIGLEIEFFIRRQGYEIAFAPAVVSGHRSARPHGRPSEKVLEMGDFLTMDYGAKVGGYCSDITRTVVVAEASDRHKEVYNQVLKAQLAALEAMKPGIPAKEVDALTRRILDEKNLAQYFGHGLGHGLGRLVHDSGRMNPTSETILEPGQVWTVEPGVYIEGFGGVRIEDDVVVTGDGIDILTKAPKELLVLP